MNIKVKNALAMPNTPTVTGDPPLIDYKCDCRSGSDLKNIFPKFWKTVFGSEF